MQKVETISLNDLLAAYNAPRAIDFLSLDTEGSELEILSAFDFSKYEIELIAVEHNFTSNEAEIEKLLAHPGLSEFRATCSVQPTGFYETRLVRWRPMAASIDLEIAFDLLPADNAGKRLGNSSLLGWVGHRLQPIGATSIGRGFCPRRRSSTISS